MVARLFVGAALIVLGAGFLWFAGNVIYLGVREFFKSKQAEPPPTTAAPTATATTPTPTAP